MPWGLIERLPASWRVDVQHTGYGGICDYRNRRIIIDPGLPRYRERSILAHEAIHALRGPFPRWMTAREEEQVSRAAARHLIPFPALLEAVAWSRVPAEVAEELDVDLPTLEARIRGLHPSERAALKRRLENLDGHP